MINSFSWGNNPDGTPFTERKPLKTHNCTREELNLEGDGSNAKLFPIHRSSKSNIDFYWKKFLCVDPEEMRISGDYNSKKARQINIQLQKCQGEGCKNETEITKFFKNKFMYLHINEVNFVTDGFDSERVNKESRS